MRLYLPPIPICTRIYRKGYEQWNYCQTKSHRVTDGQNSVKVCYCDMCYTRFHCLILWQVVNTVSLFVYDSWLTGVLVCYGNS